MKFKLLPILFIGFLISSCQKDKLAIDTGNKDINNLMIPESFNWKTTKDVSFNVGVSDARFQNKLHIITIYSADPANGGSILSKGAASLVTPFNSKITLASGITEVYIMKTAPDATKIVEKVAVSSNSISLSISENGFVNPVSSLPNSKASGKSIDVVTTFTSETSPDCSSCSNEITSNTSNLDLKNKGTYCVTGNNITVNIQNTNGGTLLICGTNVTINGLKITSNVNVIVTSKGSATFNNLNWDGNGTFKNFGTITGSLGNVKVNGAFYNAPSKAITVGDFAVQSGTVTNLGIINASSNTQISGGTFNNEGILSTSNLSLQNGGTSFTSTGTVTVNSNLDNSGTFITSGVLTVKGNLNSISGNPTFQNSGTITLNGNSAFTGVFTNSNIMNVNNGELNLNSNKSFTNSGIITANNSKANVSGTVNNSGLIIIKELNNTGSGKIINNCKIHVLTNFNNDSSVENYSYIQVDNSSNLKGVFNLYNGAMFATNYLIAADGIVEGKGMSTSLLKVLTSSTNNVNENGSGKFRGNLQYCDPSRTIKSAQFTGAAVQSCNVNIPTSSCNTAGNGNPPIVIKDRDGDGIIDSEDDYPDDPTRAFNNYSLNYKTGGSSVAFEDNWPLKGDYDLNDVVITYRYLVITNSENKIVHLKGEYKLIASGGSYESGFGVQFNLPRASAKKFEATNGTYLEENQDSVVVIVLENTRKEQTTWNTVASQPVSSIKEYTVSFDIENGPSLDQFGIGSYNPFIWNNSVGFGRGYETHLFGKNATNKVNKSLFGTGDDNSIKGKSYSTADNLPWGIELATAPFQYPNERTTITDAYLKFSAWAGSGGTQFLDWYTNTSSGYRKSNEIYNK